MRKSSFLFSYAGYLSVCLGIGTVLGTLFAVFFQDWLWNLFSELPGRLEGPKIVFARDRRYWAYLCLWRSAELLLPGFLAEGSFKRSVWGIWMFGFSFLLGIWLSLFTLRYRIWGIVKFGKTLFPQWLFYGLGVRRLAKDGEKEKAGKGKGILFVLIGLFAEISFDFP